MKLNLKNPEGGGSPAGAVGSWIQDFGIDGLRLTLPNCVGSGFLPAAQKLLQGEKPDFWLMGEIIHGDAITASLGQSGDAGFRHKL